MWLYYIGIKPISVTLLRVGQFTDRTSVYVVCNISWYLPQKLKLFRFNNSIWMLTQVSNRTNNGALIVWGESRGNIPTHVKVYMTDFFNCSIKSPQCTDKNIKKKLSIAIFLPRVLTYQKRKISLPGGYKTARPKRRLEMIMTSFQDLKLQISQSFSYCELINSPRKDTKVCCL